MDLKEFTEAKPLKNNALANAKWFNVSKLLALWLLLKCNYMKQWWGLIPFLLAAGAHRWVQEPVYLTQN